MLFRSKKDQRIAAEMDIKTYPEVVITSTFPEFAFALNPQESFDIIKKFILHSQDLHSTNHHHCLHSSNVLEK